jgi:hypothetical protein
MSFLEDYLGTGKGSTTALELFDALDADGGGDLSVGELRQTARFSAIHGGDVDGDGAWTLTELLRVVQLFNAGSYSCGVNGGATEDGYLPGDSGTTDCTRHSADYGDPAWALELSEVLRVVQLYNVGTYVWCPEQATEDGYCLDPTR